MKEFELLAAIPRKALDIASACARADGEGHLANISQEAAVDNTMLLTKMMSLIQNR